MPGTNYGRDDAAKDTNVDPKEVDGAWHVARDHARRSGELPKKKGEK